MYTKYSHLSWRFQSLILSASCCRAAIHLRHQLIPLIVWLSLFLTPSNAYSVTKEIKMLVLNNKIIQNVITFTQRQMKNLIFDISLVKFIYNFLICTCFSTSHHKFELYLWF